LAAGRVDEQLRRRLLELLRSDWEFRRAVAAELGLLEILERFARLEEEFRKLYERQLVLEERQQKLEERFAELEKRFADLEQRFASLEEKFAQLEKRFADLEERFLKLEERVTRLEERVARLEERLEEHSKAIRSLQEEVARHSRTIERLGDAVSRLASAVSDLTARITAVGYRYGVFTEAAFRDAVRFLVEDLLREYRVERWEYYDGEGMVYGHPSMVEADVLIRDREHILVEYKASADRGDVAELYRLGILYEKATGVRPRLLLVSPAIRRRAAELARRLSVELRGNIVD